MHWLIGGTCARSRAHGPGRPQQYYDRSDLNDAEFSEYWETTQMQAARGMKGTGQARASGKGPELTAWDPRSLAAPVPGRPATQCPCC